MLLSVLSLPTFSQVIDFIEMMKSSRAQHAFRLQRRFPGHPVITAQLADLFGVSFVSARVSVNFSEMFRRLRLCAQKSVSRKQRTPVRRGAVRMQVN